MKLVHDERDFVRGSQDPGASDEESGQGQITFDIGTFFSKGQSMGTGKANVTNIMQWTDLILVAFLTVLVLTVPIIAAYIT